MRCILAGLLGVLVAITPAEAGSPFDGGSDPFPADMYPSQRRALDELARQVAAVVSEAKELKCVWVNLQPGEGTNPHQLEMFIESLRAQLPQGVKVVGNIHDAEGQGENRGATLAVRDLKQHKGGWSSSTTINSGRFVCSTAGTGPNVFPSVAFIEKPWADDWAMFLNMNPSTRWLSATSQTPCISDNEAIAAARKAAVPALSDLVLTEMRARNARSSGPKIPVTDEWVRNLVADSLKRNLNGLIIKDTFIQKFSRPYGDVWQASILIDASPKVIGILNDSYNNAANAQFGKKAKGFGALGAMVLVIGLLYAFINAVTKGYFMWRLRAVALLAAIAVVLAVFAVT